MNTRTHTHAHTHMHTHTLTHINGVVSSPVQSEVCPYNHHKTSTDCHVPSLLLHESPL